MYGTVSDHRVVTESENQDGMKRTEWLILLFAAVLLLVAFFPRIFFFREIPFPGDLLVSEYKPWRTYAYLGFDPGGIPNKAQFPDTLRQLYPWKTAVITSLKSGVMPLWNPYNFSGSPLLANVQSAVLYPLNILYIVLPQIDAWTILVILQPALAFLFTFAYARKIGLGTPASAFTAISYAFSSFMIVWLEYNSVGHVILWLPLLLLAVEHLRDRWTTRWISAFTVALMSTLFAGHIQVFVYLLILTSVYAHTRIEQRETRRHLMLVLLLSLAVGSIQLIPTGELLFQAARSSHAYREFMDKILIQPWQLVMFVVRDFFGNPATRNYWPGDTYVGKITSIGIVPLLFLPLALSRIRKNLMLRFFVIASIVVLVLVTSNPLTAILYTKPIPILSSSSPTLGTFLLCFSVAVLCGFGFDQWIRERTKRTITTVIPLLLVLVVLWGIVATVPVVLPVSPLALHKDIAIRNLGFASALFALSFLLFLVRSNKPKMQIVIIFLIAVHLIDLWQFARKFTPFTPRSLIFPQTTTLSYLRDNAGMNRFWGHGSAVIEANFATQYALYSPEGYDPLYPQRYGEFIAASVNGTIPPTFTGSTRSDATIAPSNGDLLLDNPYRMKVLAVLGVRFILNRDENGATGHSFPADQFSPVFRDNGWTVYEYLRATPRVVLATAFDTYRTKDDFTRKFFNESFDPARSVLLEGPPAVAPDDRGAAYAEIASYTPREVAITVQSDGNRILVLSDTFYPGWHAFVDDVPAKILVANYAFRGVSVPKGEHIVRFLYKPDSYTIGSYMSFVSLIGLIIVIRSGKKTYDTK